MVPEDANEKADMVCVWVLTRILQKFSSKQRNKSDSVFNRMIFRTTYRLN